VLIDLFSDTVTRPTPAMRRAMCEAEVGDEQLREDPTVNRLQETVAALLAKEAALFLPSGTMCNQVAFAVHCRAGDEILLHELAHPLLYEAGGAAATVGAIFRTLPGPRGMFTAEQVRAAVRPPVHYMPRSRVVSVEQTANIVGGACWPLAQIESVCAAAREAGLACHMDGARLLNAVVATGTAARAFAAPFNSVWIDLTKGLGAPVGAVLAGSEELITEAWRYKQMLGGAMRQSGMLAAACLHALEHHVERLAEDHVRARRLATGIAQLPGVEVDPAAVDTNIVICVVDDAPAVAARLAEAGVLVGAVDKHRIRAVTHLDVDDAGIDSALAAFEAALGG